MMFVLTCSPDRMASEIDARMRRRSTFFLIVSSVSFDPLSGAYVMPEQPLRAMSESMSPSSASDRVPGGIVQEIFRSRSINALVKRTTHFRSRIVVKS